MYAQVTLINHLLTYSLTSTSSEIIRVSAYLRHLSFTTIYTPHKKETNQQINKQTPYASTHIHKE